ncbi:hypothetical protein FOBRF1_006991 [Fusarium oxysporum]
MSSLIAVAGGTGNLGRTIVEAIVADGKFEVVILGRKHDEKKEKEIGARIIPVDYTSIDALTKVLEDNRIQTVISALNTMGVAEPELNLIAAADRASATKRYIPSIWGAEYTEAFAEKFPLGHVKLAVARALESTKLEHTTWHTGYFADYFLAPYVKTHMTILNVVVDVANNTAAIPGSGNVPVVLTYTMDIAKFVAASLALSKWEPKTYLVGDKVTWNELVALAESIKGVKFSVTYDTVDSLKAGNVTELPSHPAMYSFLPKEQLRGILATFGLMFDSGLFDLKPQHTIDQDFPDIKVRNMKELMTEAWKGK